MNFNFLAKFSQRLLPIVFCAFIFSSAENIYAEDQCEIIKLNFLQRAIQAFKVRWGSAVFANDSFDLRIAKVAFNSKSEPINELKVRASQLIGSNIDTLRKLGFATTRFIHVIAEAHSGAVGHLRFPGGKWTWIISESLMPYMSGLYEFIGLPTLIPMPGSYGRRLFLGKSMEKLPRLLVLPKPWENFHSLDSRFIIAHELVHATEAEELRVSLEWREARADLLAYVLTGETKLVVPGGTKMITCDQDGKISYVKRETIRDLANPVIRSIKEIFPSSEIYHDNSQIIGNILFEFGRKFGNEKLVAFIKWFDRFGPKLPYLDAKKRASEERENTLYVEGGQEARSAIVSILKSFEASFKTWVKENIDAQDHGWVDELFRDRDF